MKFLLIQPIEHLSFLDGASKANRIMVEGLAECGHTCRVLGWSGAKRSSHGNVDYAESLQRRGIAIDAQSKDVIAFRHRGVEVRTVLNAFRWHALIHQSIEELRPDCIVISEDPGFYFLETALEADAAPVVYIAHSQASLPFGPESFVPDSDRRPEQKGLLQRASAVITVSNYVKSYIERWCDAEATVLRFPVYGSGPFACRDSTGDDGYITMINPSKLKGITIFLALARRFPQIPFAAIPTWATTGEDMAAMDALANVSVWEPIEDIDELYGKSRILLVPSLWGEAFGQVAVEAMLRGVPVLASDVGGLPEAKLGVDHVLPAEPITQYEPRTSDQHIPIPVVPEQDITPWAAALADLVRDPVRYRQLAQQSRETAHDFVSALSIAPFEDFFQLVVTRHRERRAHSQDPPPATVTATADQAAPRRALLSQLSPAKRALLAARLRRRAQSASAQDTLPIAERSPGKRYPLSYAQERLWLLQQLDQTGAAYNTALTYRIHGELDPDRLRRSVQILVDRHEALQVRFGVDAQGRPWQRLAAGERVGMPVIDVVAGTDLASDRGDTDELVRNQIRTALAEPFDLQQGAESLFRVRLLRLGPAEHVFALVIHHSNFDGWSAGVFARELVATYSSLAAERTSTLPNLAVNYIDYAVWQRTQCDNGHMAPHLAYWRQQLGGRLPVLDLPMYRPRPKIQSFRGDQITFSLPRQSTQRLRTLGQEVNATLFMTLLAGFKVLLHRYTREEDIVVGTLTANRERPALEYLVGLFLNSLVLRTAIAGNPTFMELLARVRDITLDAYSHQAVPIELLSAELNPRRDASYHPLFQVLLVLQNAPDPAITVDGLTLEPLHFDSIASDLDLEIHLLETDDGLAGKVIFNTDLIAAADVKRLMAQYAMLLTSIADEPHTGIWQLAMMSPSEYDAVRASHCGPQRVYPLESCVHALIERHARNTPDAVAVALPDDGSLTYEQLDRQARWLALRLRELGVGPEVPVVLCCDKRPALIVAMLAIFKAGGAYVPIEPSYPAERIAHILRDSGARLVLTISALGVECPAHTPVLDIEEQLAQLGDRSVPPLPAVAGPDNAAYIIYTSGSTGQPKGVMVRHRSLTNYACSAVEDYQLCAGERVLQFASISWDTSAEEIFPTLTAGATLVLRPPHMIESSAHFLRMCTRYRLDVVNLPTAFWHELAAAVERDNLSTPANLRLVIVGGERVSWHQVQRWHRHIDGNVRLVNTYGCTEATAVSTLGDLEAEVADIYIRRETPIGRPIANIQTHVLDSLLQPVPTGMPGELYIAGEGLAAGYVGQPSMTAEKFVPNPFSREPGARMYRTGDLVRMLPDGHMECLGRIDKQIKVRGIRIEPAEIEAVIEQYPGVGPAVVMSVTDAVEQNALVAYVVAHRDASEESEAAGANGLHPEPLRRHMAQSLPDFMIPSRVIVMQDMPMTTSGKIDRKRLPIPGPTCGGSNEGQRRPPCNEVQRRLVAIWREVMGIDDLGIDDDFFALGGHSLMAVRLITRIERVFGRRLSLATLLQSPTIDRLATVLAADENGAAFANLVAIQPKGQQPPLFLVPGSGGNVMYLRPLAMALGADQPCYGLQSTGLDGHTPPVARVEDMANQYITAMREIQPHGPYFLAGHSFGSTVAYEMAYQLEQSGHRVALVASFDNPAPFASDTIIGADWDQARWTASVATMIERMFSIDLNLPESALSQRSEDEQLMLLLERLQAAHVLPPDADVAQVSGFVRVFQSNTQARYIPRGKLQAPIALFRAERFARNDVDARMSDTLVADPTWGWQKYTSGEVTVHRVAGDHLTMLSTAHVASLARALKTDIQSLLV